MVWPFSSSSSSSTPETPAVPQQKPTQFLEDLPPKFDDHSTARAGGSAPAPDSGAEGSILTRAVGSIQPSDFGKLHEMPCFREAILTGGAVGGVVFAVLVTTRSPIPRALNWSVGGFLVGATVSWEQCRFKLRQEKKNQLMAREMYRRQNNGNGPVPPPSA